MYVPERMSVIRKASESSFNINSTHSRHPLLNHGSLCPDLPIRQKAEALYRRSYCHISTPLRRTRPSHECALAPVPVWPSVRLPLDVPPVHVMMFFTDNTDSIASIVSTSAGNLASPPKIVAARHGTIAAFVLIQLVTADLAPAFEAGTGWHVGKLLERITFVSLGIEKVSNARKWGFLFAVFSIVSKVSKNKTKNAGMPGSSGGLQNPMSVNKTFELLGAWGSLELLGSEYRTYLLWS